MQETEVQEGSETGSPSSQQARGQQAPEMTGLHPGRGRPSHPDSLAMGQQQAVWISGNSLTSSLPSSHQLLIEQPAGVLCFLVTEIFLQMECVWKPTFESWWEHSKEPLAPL